MAILVTGGAGYIGSVTVELLCEQGEEVVVLDNLSRGHRAAAPDNIPFYQGDIGDIALIESIVREHAIEACIHFAAFAYVGESVVEPASYYENNVAQGVRLLEALRSSEALKLVFSSTCATYGEPQRIPIGEDHPQQPTNPYGWSKLMMERILESYDAAYGLKFTALRYFNAAGATAQRGEHHEPETHLIPNVLAAAQKQISEVPVFGRDYPTKDGTAVRDYIHVSDLAEAHILALKRLRSGGDSLRVNLGTGRGYTVLEVIDSARRVTDREIEIRMEPRRPGDPSHLVADAARAKAELEWTPRYPSLDDIIDSAWKWRIAHPKGYDNV